MQFEKRIRAIERRAEALRLTVPDLCRRANVPPSTIWRWRRRLIVPTERTFDRHCAALEAALDREVQALRLLVRSAA